MKTSIVLMRKKKLKLSKYWLLFQKQTKEYYQLLEVSQTTGKTEMLDKVLGKFETHNITRTNELFYVGASVVTIRLGVKRNREAGRKRNNAREFKNKLKELRKDLRQIEALQSKGSGRY